MENQIDKLQNEDPHQSIPASKIIRQNAITVSSFFILFLIITHFLRDQLMEYNTWVSLGYFTILLLIILLTQIQVREKTYNGIITFNTAFSAGMKLSLWVTIIFALFNIFFYLVIFPEASEEMVRMAEKSMRDQGIGEEEIKMGLRMTSWLVSPLGVFISTLVIYPIMGAILSLIAAIFTQRIKK